MMAGLENETSDDSSLGDWVEDRRKLPEGLGKLGEEITAMGMQFGLWFEPEMVSPDSDLYREHPDWCLHVPEHTRTLARQQLILDLSRQDVQNYIVDSVSSVLSIGANHLCEMGYEPEYDGDWFRIASCRTSTRNGTPLYSWTI